MEYKYATAAYVAAAVLITFFFCIAVEQSVESPLARMNLDSIAMMKKAQMWIKQPTPKKVSAVYKWGQLSWYVYKGQILSLKYGLKYENTKKCFTWNVFHMKQIDFQ